MNANANAPADRPAAIASALVLPPVTYREWLVGQLAAGFAAQASRP